MSRRARTLALLLAGAFVGSVGSAGSAGAEEAEELGRRVDVSRRALERILADETSLGDELEKAEAAYREAEFGWKVASTEALAAAEAAEPARREEREAALDWGEKLRELRPRLVSRYRLLRRGAGFAAEDPASALRLSWGMDRILDRDLALLEETRTAHRSLAEARRRMEEMEAHARAMEEAAAARLEDAREKKEEWGALLHVTRTERRMSQKAHEELLGAQRRLSAKLARLRGGKGGGGFHGSLGALPWPVEGAVVEVPFGKVVNAKFHTVTFHQGLDLRVQEGTKVVAVGAGNVAFAGWLRGYGNLVIVDHGGGYHSLYGHLASFDVGVGDSVKAEDGVGTVGDTGSLKGPFLYFELRQGGKPADPLPWFKKR